MTALSSFGLFDIGVFDSARFDTQPLDHTEDYTVPEQFKGQTVLPGLIALSAERAQTLQLKQYELFASRNLATAEGATLTLIGQSVGEERLGRSDIDYRAAIYTRIAANNAKGRTEDILSVAALLAPNASSIIPYEYYPACYIVDIRSDSLPTTDWAYVAATLEAIEPLGVRGQTTFSATSGYFGFSDDPNATGFDDGPFREIYD